MSAGRRPLASSGASAARASSVAPGGEQEVDQQRTPHRPVREARRVLLDARHHVLVGVAVEPGAHRRLHGVGLGRARLVPRPQLERGAGELLARLEVARGAGHAWRAASAVPLEPAVARAVGQAARRRERRVGARDVAVLELLDGDVDPPHSAWSARPARSARRTVSSAAAIRSSRLSGRQRTYGA